MSKAQLSFDDLILICRRLLNEVTALKAILAANGPISDAVIMKANKLVFPLVEPGKDKLSDALRKFIHPPSDSPGHDQIREIVKLSGRHDYYEASTPQPSNAPERSMTETVEVRPHKDTIVIFRDDAEWRFELHSKAETGGTGFHNKFSDRAATLDELLKKIGQRYT